MNKHATDTHLTAGRQNSLQAIACARVSVVVVAVVVVRSAHI